MSLNLNDLMKKAKERDISKTSSNTPSPSIHSPWRDESILFQKESVPQLETDNKIDENNNSKTRHKLNTNYTQEVDTNLTQTKHTEELKNTKYTQTKHKLDTKLNTQKTQSTHKLNTNHTQTKHISTLIGVQRTILLFIFEECKKARSHTTEPMSILYIASSLNIASGSIKTSIARLCEKNFIKVLSFKNGRGGWSTYGIPDDVYNELLQNETRHKLHTNLTQTTHKLDTKLDTQPNTSDSRRRDLLYIEASSNISEWDFDISSYEKFGFTKTRLKQLSSVNKLTAEEVKQSLVEFEYDLTNRTLPTNIKTSPINYLMGGLIKGSPYTSEVFQKEMNRAANEMREKYELRQLERQKTSLLAWFDGLNDEELKKMESGMPIHLKIRYQIEGIFANEVFGWVKDYFLRLAKCL